MVHTLKTFKKNAIQKVINEIQTENETPDFMKVVVSDDYDLESDGSFRDSLTGEAFFVASSSLTDEKALLKELADALIKLSL